MSAATPAPPSSLIFISDDLRPGVYLAPSNSFRTAHFQLIPLFHRTITSVDHFLAAFLSLILLAVLTAAAHTILLRTTAHNPDSPLPSRTRLLSIALFSDFTHLRLPWHIFQQEHVQSLSHARPFNPRPPSTLPPLPTPTALVIAVFTVFLAVAAVDALILVVAFHPRPFKSTGSQYALHGIHPVAAPLAISRRITRNIKKSICTTPVIPTLFTTLSTSTVPKISHHRYLLTTCVYTNTKHHNLNSDMSNDSKNVSISSYPSLLLSFSSMFHLNGADHNITVGNSTVMVRVRVTISHADDTGNFVSRPMLFRGLDDENHTITQYLHERAAKYVDERLSQPFQSHYVSKDNQRLNNVESRELNKGVSSGNVAKQSKVVRDSHRFHDQYPEAIKSSFKLKNAPMTSDKNVNIAQDAVLETLVPTLAVVEAAGRDDIALGDALNRNLGINLGPISRNTGNNSERIDQRNGSTSLAVDGLQEQEGKVAGVTLLAVVSIFCVMILSVLRWRLCPTSLGEVAWQHLEGVQSRREWLASHPELSRDLRRDNVSQYDRDDDKNVEGRRNTRWTAPSMHSDDGLSSFDANTLDPTFHSAISVYVCPPVDD